MHRKRRSVLLSPQKQEKTELITAIRERGRKKDTEEVGGKQQDEELQTCDLQHVQSGSEGSL